MLSCLWALTNCSTAIIVGRGVTQRQQHNSRPVLLISFSLNLLYIYYYYNSVHVYHKAAHWYMVLYQSIPLCSPEQVAGSQLLPKTTRKIPKIPVTIIVVVEVDPFRLYYSYFVVERESLCEKGEKQFSE